jgi:hypothetical protein
LGKQTLGRFVLLILSLSATATTDASAVTVAQAKAKFMNDCPARLRIHPETVKNGYSNGQLRTFCSCVLDHALRVTRQEARDFVSSGLTDGSMLVRFRVAVPECSAKAGIRY